MYFDLRFLDQYYCGLKRQARNAVLMNVCKCKMMNDAARCIRLLFSNCTLHFSIKNIILIKNV